MKTIHMFTIIGAIVLASTVGSAKEWRFTGGTENVEVYHYYEGKYTWLRFKNEGGTEEYWKVRINCEDNPKMMIVMAVDGRDTAKPISPNSQVNMREILTYSSYPPQSLGRKIFESICPGKITN